MTRRQRHLTELADVPGADDDPARVRIRAQQLDRARDLIHGLAVGRRPTAPLLAVDGSEIAVLVGPFVPDRDTVLVQVADVRITP